MEGLYVLVWFIILSPLLPFLAIVGTGLTVLLLRIIAAVGHEYL